MRIFIGIEVSKSSQQSLLSLQNHWIPAWESYHLTQPNNFHITLCFIGELSLEALNTLNFSLQKIASSFSPFDISLKNIDEFEKNHRSIVYTPVTAGRQRLFQLSDRIKQLLTEQKIAYDPTPFTPHITLARSVRWQSKPESFFSPLPTLYEHIQSFHVYESTRINGELVYLPLFTYSFNNEV